MARPVDRIKRWAPVRNILDWSDKVIIPGTEGLSLLETFRFFIRGIQDNRITVSCAAVTYNFVMALPPTLLVIFSLVPYLPLRNVQGLQSQRCFRVT